MHHGISTACAVWSLLACACQVAWAGSGAKISMPLPPKGMVNGLMLTLDCEWVEGRGYRPVTIDVTSGVASAADRTLEIELNAGMWPTHKYVTVATDLELPAGTLRASKVISVPQFATMQFVSLDVWEDGVHLDDLSFEDRALSTTGIGSWGWGAGEMPSILFVTPSQLDLSELSFLSPQNMYVPGDSRLAFTNALQVTCFAERKAAELVEDWINYSSLDVIFISLADVKALATTRPKVWQSLREWTWAGGNLCVYGANDDSDGLAALDQRLSFPASADQASQPNRGWHEAPRKLFRKGLTTAAGVDTSDDDPPADGDAGDPSKPLSSVEPPRPDFFVWREAMLGRVVAIADAAPFPGERDLWQWVFNTIGPPRWKWRSRHGVALDGDNPGFDNFLIADIGLPPIRTYRVLITLFVLAIGPLNYWILRRYGRLHLLLFSVPAAALVASLALIGYAFVADGLESRLRARSFTLLDQRLGQSVSWARLSYYTGFAPSAGLLFDGNTTVFPLERAPDRNSITGRRRQLNWTPEQHLARGWLPSRTPTQYVTVRACRSRRELTVIASDDPQRYTVKNRLGTTIKRLLLFDDAGQAHFGNQIASQGGAVLDVPATDEAVRQALDGFLAQLNRDPPRLPAQLDADSSVAGGLFPSLRVARTAWRNQGDYQDTTNSLLEVELAQVLSSLATRTFKPRSYVAIVERPPDVLVGIDGLIETQSLHVIAGQW